ncbi:MAG TPA: 50S ribosomal protein L1 [Firmicutes bacterium]|nr:50S ribosomal protein L1 [Bacillota bacterium]
MSKLTKNQKVVYAKVDPGKQYKLPEACELIKDTSFTKFDASVDMAVRLGVDPRKANQMVRGVVTLPHGTGKQVRVLVLCTPDKEEEAKTAGADHVGLDEYIEKIKGGWTDVDVIICTPSVMAKIGPIGRILGPRGLMPNPKTGTVTMDVARAVKEIKAGKVEYRTEKAGIIHVPLGKASFDIDKLIENFITMMEVLIKAKPAAAKGQYLRSVTVSSTMGPGVKVNPQQAASMDKEA